MIPEGWKLSIVGHHTNLLSGFAFKSKEYTDSHDGIRLLRGDNIAQGNLRWRGAKLWSQNKVKKLDKYYLNEGDFVIAMDRTWIPAGVKVSQVQESDLPCLLVQRVSRLRANPSFLQELLKQHFFSHRFEQYVKKVQTETAVPHISPTDIREFPILVPPLPEQKKIAEILSTWDKAIETVEKLIANSQQKKKSLMQQLLTGKKRFPEFDGEWKEVRLGDIGEISSAGVDKKIVESEKSVRLLNYLDVLNRDFIEGDQLNHWVTAPDRKIQGCNIQQGDVFFTPSSETRDDIAHSAVALETIPDTVYSYHIVRFRLHENWDLLFRTYAFKPPSFYKQAFSLCEGGGQRYVISQRYFRNMRVSIPTDIEEQKRIAAVLFSTDQEIETWQQELAHLQQEKKALMQQLLTGKRRVKLSKQENYHANLL